MAYALPKAQWHPPRHQAGPPAAATTTTKAHERRTRPPRVWDIRQDGAGERPIARWPAAATATATTAVLLPPLALAPAAELRRLVERAL